jgi:hypothetical protein
MRKEVGFQPGNCTMQIDRKPDKLSDPEIAGHRVTTVFQIHRSGCSARCLRAKRTGLRRPDDFFKDQDQYGLIVKRPDPVIASSRSSR